jgi:flagellar assembly protein FliH
MALITDTKSSLTAWERWELASFDEPGHAKLTDASAAAEAAEAAATAEVAVPPVPTFSAEEIEYLREAAKKEGFEAGRQAGYDEGYAEGTTKGEAEALELGRAAAESLTTIATKLDEQLAALDQAVAEEMLALATEIAREVVRQSVELKPEVVIAVVREALTHLPLQHASIYLHPEDASLTRSYAGEQLSHAGHRIFENPKLARGDVVIESGGSHLDATLATRWRRVLEGLGQDSSWIVEDDSGSKATP